MLKIFQYNSHEITFDFGNGEIMVNATEMAKSFGKRPVDFLKLPSTKEYMAALLKSVVKNSHNTGRKSHNTLVRTFTGNSPDQPQGTWVHRRLALRFAQWLSPEFAVWVDERLEELLTTGSTSIQPMNQFDLMRMQIQMMEESALRISAVEQGQAVMERKVLQIEAKVTDVNTDYYTLAGYYKLKGRRWDLSPTEAQSLGKKLSNASRMNGYTIGKTYSASFTHVNTYHTDVLKAVLGF